MSNKAKGTRMGAEVVRRVLRLSSEGLGAKAIASQLYDQGVAVSASTVWRILKREGQRGG